MAAEVVALSPASRLPSLSSMPAASSSSSRAHRAARPARLPPALAVTACASGRRRQALLLLRPRATEQQGQVQQQEDEVVDGNVLPYCSIDGKKKKTIGEMEQEFLRALQSFYYDQKAIMSNEEFDNLKEELMWEGSSVVMLSANEQRLLEASMA